MAVYSHLARLKKEVAEPVGIPTLRVHRGHIRNDALNPLTRYAQMPLYVLGPDGKRGMLRRQCTAEYKIAAIKPQVRKLLGFPHPRPVLRTVFADNGLVARLMSLPVRPEVATIFPMRAGIFRCCFCRAAPVVPGTAGHVRTASATCARVASLTHRRARVSDAHCIPTRIGVKCAINGRRSGMTPSNSTRRSGMALLAPTPPERCCAAKHFSIDSVYLSTRPLSIMSLLRSGAPGKPTCSTSSRTRHSNVGVPVGLPWR